MQLIPIYDDNPTKRFPYVTITLITINVMVFVYQILNFGMEWALGGPTPIGLFDFILQYGVVPTSVLGAVQNQSLDVESLLPLVTSIFLHANLIHLGGNLLYLWIFGNNVEDHLGHLRFLAFYLFAGVVGASLHVYFNADSFIPSIGASGAIAGVLGAYLLLYPRAQVVNLAFLIIIFRLIRLPAAIVLGFWLVLQIFSGLGSIGDDPNSGGVAWFAHLGGFIVGIAVALTWPINRSPVRQIGSRKP